MLEARCAFCETNLADTGQVCNDRPLAVGRCPACGLVQVSDKSHAVPAHYAADGYFPEDIGDVLLREAPWNEKRVRLIRRHLQDAATRKALDYGCGPGGFLRLAGSLFSNLTGFDLSPRMCRLHTDEGRACVCRLEDVPEGIDTLLLFHVLEHMPEPWKNLEALLAFFPKVSRVVVEVPNTGELLNSRLDCPAYRQNHHSADHLYYFTQTTLARVLERAGLFPVLATQHQRYTLANNLGWLAEGKGGGQHRHPQFNDAALNEAYERVLVENGLADSLFVVAACKVTA